MWWCSPPSSWPWCTAPPWCSAGLGGTSPATEPGGGETGGGHQFIEPGDQLPAPPGPDAGTVVPTPSALRSPGQIKPLASAALRSGCAGRNLGRGHAPGYRTDDL